MLQTMGSSRSGPKPKCKSPDCYANLPKGRRTYCSDRCANREKSRKRRTRLRKEKMQASGDLQGGARKSYRNDNRGVVYSALIESGLGEKIMLEQATQADAARALGVTATAISKAMGAVRRHMALQVAQADWRPDPEHFELLLTDTEPDVDDPDAFEAWLDDAVARFVKFRETFFATARGPYYTEAFHQRWIKAILRAIYTGGQQMILSPPRHGKSELLVHFCAWLIVRNPNIQILWVGGNEDIAKLMVGKVRSELSKNEELKAAYLPPGDTWEPPGRHGTWRSDEFTVANQDSTLVKSPTMTAQGRGGTILSRDCDIIITDDIEDQKTTQQPGMRNSTREWYTGDLDSRKEEHTAWIFIGSHQHPDGLSVHLLDDPAWNAIVDMAHDYISCNEDPDDPDLHIECMLFPKLRSYAWLRKKQLSHRALGVEARFDLQYLMRVVGTGLTVFDEDQMKACTDESRVFNRIGIPEDARLIAGLDPSSTGYQAAVCWGYSSSTGKLYLIDIDNTRGGGVESALQLMKDWRQTHHLHHWVIEENGFQKAIRLNRDVKEWTAKAGVWTEGHETQGGNKHDPSYGVASMAGLYKAGLVNLPFAGPAVKERVLSYIKQAVQFDGSTVATRRRGIKSDILMASWFPFKIIRQWMEEDLAEEPGSDEYEPVFATFQGVDYGEAPW